MELGFADTAHLKQEGRSFFCSTCPESTQKARRCREDRWDFTSADSQVFPIYVTDPKGELYGFCPGKATWDYQAVTILRILSIAADTGAMLKAGGIEEQPDWFIELLGWFLPRYDMMKFSSKARMVLGNGQSKEQLAKAAITKAKGKPHGGHNR